MNKFEIEFSEKDCTFEKYTVPESYKELDEIVKVLYSVTGVYYVSVVFIESSEKFCLIARFSNGSNEVSLLQGNVFFLMKKGKYVSILTLKQH